MTLTPDRLEFTEARWRTQEQVQAEVPQRFDPHYQRFMTKLKERPGYRAAHARTASDSNDKLCVMPVINSALNRFDPVWDRSGRKCH